VENILDQNGHVSVEVGVVEFAGGGWGESRPQYKEKLSVM
jgi:hypothetical protein